VARNCAILLSRFGLVDTLDFIRFLKRGPTPTETGRLAQLVVSVWLLKAQEVAQIPQGPWIETRIVRFLFCLIRFLLIDRSRE
jgi:hypothetical protein